MLMYKDKKKTKPGMNSSSEHLITGLDFHFSLNVYD